MFSKNELHFEPKFTEENKLDFYAQNNIENQKEEPPLYEADLNTQIDYNNHSPRKKLVPGENTSANDLNSYNNPPNYTKEDCIQQPINPYYERQILAQADLNSNIPISTQNQVLRNDKNIDQKEMKPSKKVEKQRLNKKEEHQHKNETDIIGKEKKVPGNLKVQVATIKQTNSMTHKNKNMYSKINRGISPNQPPNKLKVQKEEKKNYSNRIGKYSIKGPIDASRRSSSLKVKEKDKMKYNKPSSVNQLNNRGRGSFIAPSNSSGKPEKTRKAKISNSANNLKFNGISNNDGPSTNNQYPVGSSSGNKNIGKGNFTGNPRMKKTAANGTTIRNTMASFRSGPVKVVGESNNVPIENKSSLVNKS